MCDQTAVGSASVAQFVRPDGTAEPIHVDLHYRTADQFAVTMHFRCRQEENTWLVSRELLADGLLAPSGIGDVRLRPHVGDTLVLELFTKDSTALFHLSAKDLREFLNATYEIVGAGEETLDLDLLIKEILG